MPAIMHQFWLVLTHTTAIEHPGKPPTRIYQANKIVPKPSTLYTAYNACILVTWRLARRPQSWPYVSSRKKENVKGVGIIIRGLVIKFSCCTLLEVFKVQIFSIVTHRKRCEVQNKTSLICSRSTNEIFSEPLLRKKQKRREKNSCNQPPSSGIIVFRTI